MNESCPSTVVPQSEVFFSVIKVNFPAFNGILLGQRGFPLEFYVKFPLDCDIGNPTRTKKTNLEKEERVSPRKTTTESLRIHFMERRMAAYFLPDVYETTEQIVEGVASV